MEWLVFKTLIVTVFDTLFHRFGRWGFGRNAHAVGMWINRVEGVSNQGGCRSYPVALCIKKKVVDNFILMRIKFFSRKVFYLSMFCAIISQ